MLYILKVDGDYHEKNSYSVRKITISCETHEVREFVTLAFKAADMKLEWIGEGVDEIAVLKGTEKVVVKVNPKFFRPAEVELLIGDCSKAQNKLGWIRKVSYAELVTRMVKHDMELLG